MADTFTHTIKNPDTGRLIAIQLPEGTTLTPEITQKILEKDLMDNPLPEPEPSALEQTGNYVMEAVAAFNRPLATLTDIAISPIALAAETLGIPFVNFRQKVGEKGQFAGDSFATDVISASGELASIAIPFGMATRATGEMLSSLSTLENTSLFRQTLKNIGEIFTKTTVASDVGYGAVAGAGGEVAAAGGEITGEVIGTLMGDADTGRFYGEEAGRMTGQLITPLAAAQLLQRPRNLLNSFVQRALRERVNPNELKGAGHILYEDVKKLGAFYTDESLQKLAQTLEKTALDNGIFGLGVDSKVAAPLRRFLNNIQAQGDWQGTTVAYMMDAVQTFRNIGSKGGKVGKAAGKIADDLEYFFYNDAELAGMGRQPIIPSDTKLLRNVQPGESLPVEAQPIGQQVGTPRQGQQVGAPRTQAGDALEGEFSIHYETTPGIRFDDVSPSQQELPKVIETNYRQAGQYWRRARVLEELNTITSTAETKAGALRSGQDVIDLQIKALTKLKTDPSKFRRLSPEEQKAVSDAIASKGNGKQYFTALEKLGINSSDGVKTRLMYTLGAVTAGASGAYGNVPGMIAGATIASAQTISSLARRVTNSIVQRDINYLKALVAAGPNGEDIVKLYMQRTPKSERNAEELASLFLNNKVDLPNLNQSRVIKNNMVETAAAIAAIGVAEASRLENQ